jgi:hypothetical protein
MSRAIRSPGFGERRDEADDSFLDNLEYDQRPEAEKRADLQRRGLVAPSERASAPPDTIDAAYDVIYPASAATQLATHPQPLSAAHLPAKVERAVTGNPGFARLTTELHAQIDKKHKKARKELSAVLARIEAQEAKCAEPAVEDQLKQIDFAGQKLLLSKGTALAERLKHEQAAERDLAKFKTQQRLTREPQYPTSRLFSAGVLLALILVEAGLNGVLFAESSEAGLLGGWTEAVVLAVANVGVAFLLGFLALRALNARNLLAKAAGGVAMVAGLALILAINIFGAHYRDHKAGLHDAQIPVSAAPSETGTVVVVRPRDSGDRVADTPKSARTEKLSATSATATAQSNAGGRELAAGTQGSGAGGGNAADPFAAERAAIARALTTPWAIESFNGLFLLVIGLCAAVLALVDGYNLDDPVPGYGRRHRRLVEARQHTETAMQAALQEAGALAKSGFEAIERAVQSFAREVAGLKALHEEYGSLHAAWEKRLDEAVRDAARTLDQHRLQHRIAEPTQLDADWRADALPERHIKLLRAKEKALRAIQAQIAAEREKLLAPFTGAAAQFTGVMDTYGQRRLSI